MNVMRGQFEPEVLTADKAVIMSCKKTVMNAQSVLGEVYSREKDADGFLYLEYQGIADKG